MTFVSIHSEDKKLNLQNLIARRIAKEKDKYSTWSEPHGHGSTNEESTKKLFKRKVPKFQPKTRPSGSGAITLSTIICRYCNKPGHFEQDYKKKQYDLKGKGKRVHPQEHSTQYKIQTISFKLLWVKWKMKAQTKIMIITIYGSLTPMVLITWPTTRVSYTTTDFSHNRLKWDLVTTEWKSPSAKEKYTYLWIIQNQ